MSATKPFAKFCGAPAAEIRLGDWPRRFAVFAWTAAGIYGSYLLALYGFHLAEFGSYLNGAQPSAVLMLALNAAAGDAVYPPLEAAERISLLYGPTAYFPLGDFADAFENPVTGAKLYGALLGFGGLALLFFALAKTAGGAFAALGAAAVALFYSRFHYSADSVVFFGCCLFGFAAFAVNNFRLKIILAAIGIFFAINAKAHTGIYFLPMLWLWWETRPAERRGVLFSPMLAAILTAILFAAHPSFSLPNYLRTLFALGHLPVEEFRMGKNILNSALALTPLILVFVFARGKIPPHNWKAAIIVWAMAILPAALYFGARVGANLWHIRPLAIGAWIWAAHLTSPLASADFIRVRRDDALSAKNEEGGREGLSINGIVLTIFLSLLCIAAVIQEANRWREKILPYRRYAEAHGGAIVNELKSLKRELAPYQISAGYYEWIADYRPRPPHNWNSAGWTHRALLRGKNYAHFIDWLGAAELARIGDALSPNSHRHLAAQKIDFFVVPLPELNPAETIPRADKWAKDFRANYEEIGRSSYFALWASKNALRRESGALRKKFNTPFFFRLKN